MFIRHICNSVDSLDINVLCHVFERICGGCVVAFRMHGPAQLHDATFPRSWLPWLSTDEVAVQQDVRWNIRSTFLHAISELLETLILGHSAGKPPHATALVTLSL